VSLEGQNSSPAHGKTSSIGGGFPWGGKERERGCESRLSGAKTVGTLEESTSIGVGEKKVRKRKKSKKRHLPG